MIRTILTDIKHLFDQRADRQANNHVSTLFETNVSICIQARLINS